MMFLSRTKSVRSRIFLLSTLLLLAQCGPGWSEGVKVVATVFPLAEMARALVGSQGTVVELVPPGADPHSWAPSPSLRRQLSGAHLFLMVSPDLEPWAWKMVRSLEAPPKVISLARIKVQGPTSAADPHLWLDLRRDAALAEAMARELERLFPGRKALFEANLQRLLHRIETLDSRFHAILAGCRHKTLVVAGHAAFGWLAARYGLRQVALSQGSPDAQPSPRRLAQLIELIRAQRLPAVFAMEGESLRPARAIARETGAEVVLLNNGAVLTQEEVEEKRGFLDLMEMDLQRLAKGLQCHEAPTASGTGP